MKAIEDHNTGLMDYNNIMDQQSQYPETDIPKKYRVWRKHNFNFAKRYDNDNCSDIDDHDVDEVPRFVK